MSWFCATSLFFPFPRPRHVVMVMLFLSTSALGCRRSRVEGTVNVDSILNVWNDAGFDTEKVVNIEPDVWSAGACSRGPVAGLEVLICEYSSDDAARVGEKKMMSDWEEESVPTGAVVRTSRTLLAIADRNKADPSGRTIVRLAKLFTEQR